MDIERLRALEKAVELVAKATPGPWQAKNEYEWDEIIGNVDGPDAGQFHYSHVCSVDMNDERKPEHFANAELIIAAVNFIREHGSALIAELGQEVGAVAGLERIEGMEFWLHENVDDGDSEPVRLVMAMSHNNKVFCHRASQGDNGICNDTSPAHTSEARDAGETCQFFASGPEGSFFAKTLADAENLIDFASLDRDEWTVTDLHDAAMRQEGGSDV